MEKICKVIHVRFLSVPGEDTRIKWIVTYLCIFVFFVHSCIEVEADKAEKQAHNGES